MSVAACYVVHYGREWLAWSMRSIQSVVDSIFVFYSVTPSHGHTSGLRCPEPRAPLWDIGKRFGANFIDCGPFGWEGAHRDYAVNYITDRGFDQILVVDADELWTPSVAEALLKESAESNARYTRVGMRHFWRSLKWVCDDGAMPLRVINTMRQDSEHYFAYDKGRCFHMGYAQSLDIVRYKISVHGHKGEFRPNWFEEKFVGWHPGILDVHPTNERNFWDPKPYVDDGQLELLCWDHPYWDMELIS